MILSRRDALAGAAAFVAATGLPGSVRALSAPKLRAAPGSAQLAISGYPRTPIWGYEGGVPGPVIRVARGDLVRRLFVNNLPQPSTVHWHGIRIRNAMDGVPALTQSAVPPGGEFSYQFTVPDAGTYWYHPHNLAWEQMARGLYGALIVEEDRPPEVDRDEALLIDDWRLAGDASIDESFGAMRDWSHAGRLGNWVTVNGNGDLQIPVRRHERLRLRLVNTANARVFSLALKGLEGWIVALDGQPLSRLADAVRITLAPAQRADLIVDVTAKTGDEAFLVSNERDARYAITTFKIEGTERPERLPAPEPLPANQVPEPSHLGSARRATLRMEGGAMGRMRGAKMGGRHLGIRELVANGRVWAFNGVAEMPETPLIVAQRGETVRIPIINETGWPHGMHLHGHHFRRIGKDDRLGPLRDTILVEAGETAEIAFVADNPGDWLFHCHMLEHSASGMMTWLRVAG